MLTNNIITKLLLASITILFFQTSHAQKNYLPGYIIDTKKDTIQGFIDYKNWSSNPDEIHFKINENGTSRSYNPKNISEFRVKDEIYVSATVDIETSPLQTDRLRQDPELNILTNTVFLQTLFKGSKSLYYYRTNRDRDNFYIKEGGNFVLLIYKKYLGTADGTLEVMTVAKENKKYQGQLDLYLSKDCPATRSKLLRTEYTHKSLEKLFQHYFDCSQGDLVFQKKKEKTSVDIGVLAGVSFSSLEFKGESNLNYLTQTDFNQSTNFTTGAFVDIFFSRNLKKWSLLNELMYSQSKFEGRHHSFRNETGDVNTLLQFEYGYIKLNNLLRFYIPVNQSSLRAFINVGISNGLAINEKNYKRQDINFFGNERVVEEEALDRSRKHEQAYIIGTGLKYDKFSLEIRLEKGNGISEIVTLSSPTTKINILLGYRF